LAEDVPVPVLIRDVNTTPLTPLVEILADKLDSGKGSVNNALAETWGEENQKNITQNRVDSDEPSVATDGPITKPPIGGLLRQISKIFTENVGQFLNPGNKPNNELSPILPEPSVAGSQKEVEGGSRGPGIAVGNPSVSKVTKSGNNQPTSKTKAAKKKLLKNGLKDKIKPPQTLKNANGRPPGTFTQR
jgi:hypothetical protein